MKKNNYKVNEKSEKWTKYNKKETDVVGKGD